MAVFRVGETSTCATSIQTNTGNGHETRDLGCPAGGAPTVSDLPFV